MLHEHFRQALEDGDVSLLRKIWADQFPKMPQPKTDDEARAIMHRARTEMEMMPFAKRAYSHAWLTERSLPSALPDHLKPKAERLYPVVVGVVGIAVMGKSPIGKAIAPLISKAMSDAVMDAYAHGTTDPVFVKQRMMEARERELQKLLGKLKV
jgi:hypothetical protein